MARCTMRPTVGFALLACLVLAGCAATSPPALVPDDHSRPWMDSAPTSAPSSGAQQPYGPSELSEIRGVVVDLALRPIGGATVRLVSEEITTKANDAGLFEFPPMARGVYALQAVASGFAVGNATILPESMRDARITLEPLRDATGYNTTRVFHGIIECAFEALIISPSCDSILVPVPPEDRPFDQNYTFLYGVDLDWKTMVIDVAFDPEANSGLDGLRVSLRGIRDDVDGGNYTQYGRWHDASPFTIRVEPDGEYPDGSGPLPGNYTGFRLDVYPHGHAYHTVCDPAGGACFLGAGAGLNVEFDLYVTVFYRQGAPEGFSLFEV